MNSRRWMVLAVSAMMLGETGCSEPQCTSQARKRGGRCLQLNAHDAGLLDAASPEADSAIADPGLVPAGGPCGSCPKHASCVSSACQCDIGFDKNGETCADIDECRLGTHHCGAGSCKNTIGAYECLCPDGFTGTHTPVCTDIDECATDHGSCGLKDCTNTPGSFVCGDCVSGFIEQDRTCRWNDASLQAILTQPSVKLVPEFTSETLSLVAQFPYSISEMGLQAVLPQRSMGRSTVYLGETLVGTSALVDTGSHPLALGDNSFVLKVVTDSGATRSYQLTARRGWTNDAHIKADHPSTGDHFGYALAISTDGSTLVVGAYGEDSSATGINGDRLDGVAPDSGAAYVFRRQPEAWAFESYLKASNTGKSDNFGMVVAISADGNTIVVGATSESSSATNVNGSPQSDDSALAAGAAYVFERSNQQWQQTAYLKSGVTSSGPTFGFPLLRQFGSQVAISGDGTTIAVAEPGDSSGASGVGGSQAQNLILSGAVHIFRKNGETWSKEEFLKSGAPKSNVRFGDGLALSYDGSLLVASEPNSNVLYTFVRSGMASWSLESQPVTPTISDIGDRFGATLAISADGKRLAVGAPGEDSCVTGTGAGTDEQADNRCKEAGAVYLFARTAAGWTQEAYIKASNTAANSAFGTAVALASDGKSVVASAREEKSLSALGGDQNSPGSGAMGAAYSFRLETIVWKQVLFVKSPNPPSTPYFGSSVSTTNDGATIVVGSEYDDTDAAGANGMSTGIETNAGAAFVYE
jgi:hypothetical protein